VPSDARPVVVTVSAPLTAALVARLCAELPGLLRRDDVDQVTLDLRPGVAADLGTVDGLARLQLTAQRLGGSIRVRDDAGVLTGLLTLVGLADVVPTDDRSVVEPERQAEPREQRRRVEEVVHVDDPAG